MHKGGYNVPRLHEEDEKLQKILCARKFVAYFGFLMQVEGLKNYVSEFHYVSYETYDITSINFPMERYVNGCIY